MFPKVLDPAPTLPKSASQVYAARALDELGVEQWRGGDEAREALVRQVTLPVRWEESIRELVDHGVNTFVEVGPGRVLTGLLRQIDRSVHVFNVEDEKSLHSTLDRLAQAQTESAEA